MWRQELFKQESFFTIDYSKFDELIKEEHGDLGFECVDALEIGNDSCYELHIDGKVDKWEEKGLTEFIERGTYDYGTPSILLNDLCRQEKITPGNYLIRVSW